MKDNEKENMDIRVLLHNIRSSHNVGSIFRTSDAIGVQHIYLSGFTPAPLDRFHRPVKEIAKTALGAEKIIPWEYYKDFEPIISMVKAEGFAIIGLEQDTRSTDYKNFQPAKKTLLVVGSEVDGMTQELRRECEEFVEIPMHGHKESLNVAVAFGIAVFRLFDQ